MEMLVAPAERCPRQPDRADAERQRSEQHSELDRAEPARARRQISSKIGELGDIREALENEDRRTLAGKKDAVARFWRHAPAAKPLSLISCCGKGECLRETLVKQKKQPSSSPWMGSCSHVCRWRTAGRKQSALAVVAGYQTGEFGGRDRIHLRKYRLAVLGLPANRLCLLRCCKRIPGGVVPQSPF